MKKEMERFSDCAILPLNTKGFEILSLQKKHLVYHLNEAGLYGRNLFLQQNYEHNLVVKNVLEKMFENLQKNNFESAAFDKFSTYLKKFWIHVGIYHGMSNKRLDVDFNKNDFEDLIKSSSVSDCFNAGEIELTKKVLFDDSFTKPQKNIQKKGVDVIAESGGNFYKNMTEKDFKAFTKEKEATKFLTNQKDTPQIGFNSRLVKHPITGEIKEEVISVNGLYSDLVVKIVENLQKAVEYAENKIQKESIETLIHFYKTGSPKDFDTHSLKWVKDKESEIFFINGLIESYDDPKGIRCTFESIVAFKNPIQTEKVNKIINNIQWFESNMPVSPLFKKKEASGLSASSVTVAGMAGATSPTLPLGICLPNSDWIREKHGSKSVNLFNVANARGESEFDIKVEFFLPEYLESIKKYGSFSSSLHTDLHEVAGHGSCKSNTGVSNESLDIYYSVIEEARADLVGLYFIGRQELVDFEIIENDVDLSDYTQAAYINYITNGAMLQLKRVDFGDDLAQPHLRNRQLIVNWVLQNDTKKCVELVEKDGKKYAKINNYNDLRFLFGELLGKVQEIKSTGDFKGARDLVETYGTIVDKEIHSQVLERVKKLKTPSTYGFTTPLYKPVLDNKGNTIDYETYQKETFVEDQLYLSKKYK